MCRCSTALGRVNVVNRQDCCQDGIQNYEMVVLRDGAQLTPSPFKFVGSNTANFEWTPAMAAIGKSMEVNGAMCKSNIAGGKGMMRGLVCLPLGLWRIYPCRLLHPLHTWSK
jgi:hypothetical protein